MTRRVILLLVWMCILGLPCGMVLLASVGWRRVDVRVDAGDVRRHLLGFRVAEHRVDAVRRRAILSLTQRQPAIRAQWHAVGDLAAARSKHEKLIQYYHELAFAWIAVSPEVADLLYRDLAAYVARTRWGREEGPAFGMVLGSLSGPLVAAAAEWPPRYYVAPGWRCHPDVTAYLSARTGRSTTTIEACRFRMSIPGPPESANLPAAAEAGDVGQVMRLLVQGANPDDGRWLWLPLHEAARGGHNEAMDALLQAGADPDALDGLGWAPLHWAAAWGQREATVALVEAGAAVDPRNRYGYTPLHIAADRGHSSCAVALLSKGADPTIISGNEWTALHLAAASGCTETVEALIASGADANVRDANGSTPLHWATQHADKLVIEALLEAGADVNARDKKGRTPLAAAAKQGHQSVARLLRQHGGVE